MDCKDDFYMVKDFLLSMTDNDWKFKQIVIPFDEKKGIYCTLGYEAVSYTHLDVYKRQVIYQRRLRKRS